MWLPLLLLFSVSMTIATKGGQEDYDVHKMRDYCIARMQEGKMQNGTNLYEASAKFGIALYKFVSSTTENDSPNFFLSPVALYTDLAMLASGARSFSRKQILEAICIDPKNARKALTEDMKRFIEHFRIERERRARIASWLFTDKSVRIFPTYERDLSMFYYAKIDRIDVEDPEKALRQINDEVNRSTDGKIKNVVTEVNEKTKFIVLDYASLKGYWEKPFILENPEDQQQQQQQQQQQRQDHNKQGGIELTRVPMMHRLDHFKYLSNSEVQMVQVPFKDGQSIIFFLPRGDLRKFEQAFSLQLLERFLSMARTSQIDLYIPKIKVEQMVDLKSGLEHLGIQVFDKADLTGITQLPGLHVSQAMQKIQVELSEATAELSGDAYTEGITGLYKFESYRRLKLRFDKPFFAVIYDSSVSAIVGLGRYSGSKLE